MPKGFFRAAFNFMLAPKNRKKANNFVNRATNYAFSNGRTSPRKRQLAKRALSTMRQHAPEHYSALRGAAFRRAPRIISRAVVSSLRRT